MDYTRLMITQVKGARGERRYRSHLFDQQKIKWERAAKDHSDLCDSRAKLIQRGVQLYALGEIDTMIECTYEIAETVPIISHCFLSLFGACHGKQWHAMASPPYGGASRGHAVARDG